MGELGDFVLDLQNGRLTHATVATRSATRTVPANLLTWNEERKTWVLGMSATQFAGAPEFDVDEFRAKGADDRGEDERDEKGETQRKPAGRLGHMLLGELPRARFHATDAALGDAVETVIYADEPTIAFVLVMAEPGEAEVGDAEARTEIAIPWVSCQAREAEKQPGQTEVQVDASLAKIQAAPVPDAQAAGRRLSDATFRAGLYEHFGVQPPSFDARLGTPR